MIGVGGLRVQSQSLSKLPSGPYNNRYTPGAHSSNFSSLGL